MASKRLHQMLFSRTATPLVVMLILCSLVLADRATSGTNARTPEPRRPASGMESQMAQWDQKVRTVLGTFSLELPACLVKQEGSPVDSMAAVFEGCGLFVIATQGPYSDRLTGYVGRSDYREEESKIGGAAARMVSFQTPEEGTFTLAVHVPGLNGLTVLVRAAESVPRQVARDIVQSIQPVN